MCVNVIRQEISLYNNQILARSKISSVILRNFKKRFCKVRLHKFLIRKHNYTCNINVLSLNLFGESISFQTNICLLCLSKVELTSLKLHSFQRCHISCLAASPLSKCGHQLFLSLGFWIPLFSFSSYYMLVFCTITLYLQNCVSSDISYYQQWLELNQCQGRIGTSP